MPHYAAVHATGEVMWTQNPHALGPDWECHKLSREPSEGDEFDPATKRLKPKKNAKKQLARRSIEERLAALEDQVARLLEQK